MLPASVEGWRQSKACAVTPPVVSGVACSPSGKMCPRCWKTTRRLLQATASAALGSSAHSGQSTSCRRRPSACVLQRCTQGSSSAYRAWHPGPLLPPSLPTHPASSVAHPACWQEGLENSQALVSLQIYLSIYRQALPHQSRACSGRGQGLGQAGTCPRVRMDVRAPVRGTTRRGAALHPGSA